MFFIEQVKDEKKLLLLQLELDLGEASAIVLAMENENSLLIIDEKKGREVARAIGIQITGILGIILKAKSKGLVDKVAPVLEKLKAAGFRMSTKLERQVLSLAGE